MPQRVLRSTAALAAAVTVSGLASAAGAQQGPSLAQAGGQQWRQEGQWGQRGQKEGMGQRGQQEQPGDALREIGLDKPNVGRMASISGTISQTKKVTIGDRDPYLFAKVEDENGRERLLNLGPADEVEGLVSEGDTIEARAVTFPMLGREVYHTVLLRSDGQTKRIFQINDPEKRAALRERLQDPGQQQRIQQAGFRQPGAAEGLRELGLDKPSTGRMTSIQGTISGTKQVTIGDREPYLFAKVEDDSGRERFVNLGPAEEVEDMVSEGDQIEVRAVNVPMLGRDVYHALMLSADGRTMRVRQVRDPERREALRERAGERWQQQRSQQTNFRQSGGEPDALREVGLDRPNVGRVTSIRGTISETKKFSLGDSEPYLLARVEDDSGRERFVNLGPADELEGVCSEGDEIEVRAVNVPVFGRDVYHTLLLNANGQTMRVRQIQDPENREMLRERARDRWESQQRSPREGFQQD